MAEYMIEAPHTVEECSSALDDMAAKGSQVLNEFHWGCMAGIHSGWAFVEAQNESAAREMLPNSQRNKARIVKVQKFTTEQMSESHQQK